MSVRGTRQGRNVYRRRQQGERFQGSLATGSCQLITNWLGRDLWQALAQLDQSLSTRCTAAGGLAEAYNSQHPQAGNTKAQLYFRNPCTRGWPTPAPDPLHLRDAGRG